jgi:hypothetical protein
MPRVPTYDQNQVELQPLRAPKLDTVVTPELLNGGAVKEQADLGAALQKSGAQFADIANRVKERDDADTVFRAETALKDGYLQYEQEARKNRQGRFAKDLTADTNKWWDEQTQKQSEALTSPEARRAFAKRATSARLASLNSVSGWEATELEKSHDDAWRADKNITISTATQNPTQQNVDVARGEITRLNRYQGVRKGWDASTLENETLKDTTSLHENVIKSMAQTDPVGAAAYFEANKKEIDGKRHDEIGKFAKDVSANAIGGEAGQAIWKQYGPKGDNEPVSLDEMEKKAREALKGNEPALKAALSTLKEISGAFDKGTRERAAANAAAVSTAAMNPNVSVAAIRAMPEFQMLDGTKQAAMVEHIENSRYTRQQRSRQQADQAEADMARRNNAAFLTYSDPNVLKDMSRNQVLALLPDLGDTHTQTLLNKWEAIAGDKKGAVLSDAKMDRDDFNQIAHAAGLKPYKSDHDEDHKAMLGDLHSRIERRLGEEQQRLKRPLAREEKIKVMQQEMDNKIILDRTFWPDISKPAVLLTPDQRANAYVMVDGTRVDLAKIPATDRVQIIKARQARNLPISEVDIARTWLRAGSPMKAETKRDDRDAIRRAADSVGGTVPEEIPGPYNKPFVTNAGNAFAKGALANTSAGGWGVARAAADVISELVTGPLTRARILPEDVAARMSKTFADLQHGMNAKGADWGPQAGRDFAVKPVVPKAARAAIEQTLKDMGVPATEAAVRVVYSGFLETQREKLREWNPEP